MHVHWVLWMTVVMSSVTGIVVTEDQWYLLPEQYQNLLEYELDHKQPSQLWDRQYQASEDGANWNDSAPERRTRQAVMQGGFPGMAFMRPASAHLPRPRQVRQPIANHAGRFPGPPPGVFGSAKVAPLLPRPVRASGLQLAPAGFGRQPHALPGNGLLSPAQMAKVSQLLQLNVRPLQLPDGEPELSQAHRLVPWSQDSRGTHALHNAPQLTGDAALLRHQVASFQNLAVPPARATSWGTVAAQPLQTSSEPTYQPPRWLQAETAKPAAPLRFSQQDTDVGGRALPTVGDVDASSSQPAIKLIDPPSLGPPHQLDQLRQQQQLQEQLLQRQLEQQQLEEQQRRQQLEQQQQLEEQQRQQQLEQLRRQQLEEQQRQQQLDQQQQLQKQQELEQKQLQQQHEMEQQQQQSEAQHVEEFPPAASRKRATLKGILSQDCPTAEEDGYCASPPRYPSQQIVAAVKQCESLLVAMYAPVPEDDIVDDQEPAAETAEIVSNSTRDMVRANRQVWSWARYNSSETHSNTACSSERKRVEPGYAREVVSGRWFVVVQAGPALRQTVTTDTCSGVGKACTGLLGGKCAPRGAGFRSPAKNSRCAQRHSYQHLITWDPDTPGDCPRIRVFRFPSACVCQLGIV